MFLRAVFSIAMLIPVHAWADKGDFTFQIADSVNAIPSACVASLEYSPKDEFDSENVFLSLNSECAKPLTQLTRQNIGKTAIIFYRGNALSPVVITSALGITFRISSKQIPRVILLQMLNDYGVTLKVNG
ncbi:SecDF P1 head subdomain-containing protein [Kluyvera sp. CHPC 1.251]|uniref:SecDF P1 head subdomain-containing protein n=1 Tax=Kluyvera sp. CHPC 1.251 TaxID=2995175 RepID=UPI002FD818D7